MVEQRYNAVMEVLVHELTVTQVAERYGVSRQSVHTWIRRYQNAGMAGLADRSHRGSLLPPPDVTPGGGAHLPGARAASRVGTAAAVA